MFYCADEASAGVRVGVPAEALAAAGWRVKVPARYEPFGLCALEAGLAGCALVLGDIPSLREVWGGAALYVDPDDEALLERVLNRLIEDAELRDEMSHRARKRAALYTVERMADGYNQLYASLLSVAVPPARRPRPRSLRPVQL